MDLFSSFCEDQPREKNRRSKDQDRNWRWKREESKSSRKKQRLSRKDKHFGARTATSGEIKEKKKFEVEQKPQKTPSIEKDPSKLEVTKETLKKSMTLKTKLGPKKDAIKNTTPKSTEPKVEAKKNEVRMNADSDHGRKKGQILGYLNHVGTKSKEHTFKK